MTIVIHQPEYLPWLGFFDRIDKCDLFVDLDNVQFQKGFINRNKIKTPTGWQWLTIPIAHECHRKDIKEVRIDNQADWRKDNWQALFYNYNKAPYFKNYSGFFEDVYRAKADVSGGTLYKYNWELLEELDTTLIKRIMDILGLKTPIKKASSLGVKG